MSKKVLSLVLCLVLVLTLALSACNNNNNNEGNNDNRQNTNDKNDNTKDNDKNDSKDNDKANDEESIITEAGTFPIVKEGYDVTLTSIASTRPKTDNYEDNTFTKWAEEKFNIDFDIATVNEKEFKEKLNLLMASGDYPDFLMGVNGVFTLAEQQLYADQGILLPLNDYIEEYGVESKKIIEEFPIAKEMFTLLDGNVYTIPSVDECFHCMNTSKLWVYTPWLEALDLDMPTTTDEFYEVLKAFKTQDPNGNGENDEVPFMGANKGWETQVDRFLMGAFAYINGADNLYVEDGKIVASFISDGWKEGLAFFNKLVEEGLLATESFTQDNAQLRTVTENPEIPLVGFAPGGSMGAFAQNLGESGRYLEYKTVPALVGPSGAQYTNYKPYNSYSANFHVTDACEYPEVAFRFGDALLNWDVMMHAIYGEEGQEWSWAEDGDVGIVEEFPGVWRELIPMQEKLQNSAWEQQGPRFRPVEFRLGRVTDNPIEKILYEETKKNYTPYWPDESQILPPLIFTKDQSAELVDMQTTINEYVTEMFARFATGDADLDSDWDSYVKEVNNMGLERYIELYQEAYDDKMK